ncbi:ATP-dependent RecD-like DNA helicase [uncultured Oscillibacter sp.]|uniref:SF1B family DNA helicase RecD2 n=1 Tax=uncultured Oscillibacter sp. TaxID=876091 RepID=UPI0025E57B5E|nr:ATP-dependent RecD-like DNA helicase [uncultured Oscillibacter sp.]
MEEQICREGTVHSVIFQNAENGYTVLRLLTEEGEVVTVVGCIPCVAPGEHLTVSGVWEQHPQHGEQLRGLEMERSLPEEEEEIFSYLSSGVIKGVGPATARNIVSRFGPETFDILETAPERLATVKGVTHRKAQEIAEGFRRHMGLRRLMAFLARYQLPPVLAMRLRQQYGDAALEKLRENPYLLAGDGCGVEFSVADEIALSMGFEADSGQRLEAAVSFELGHNENNGHVFLPRNKLIAATAQLLECGADRPELALDALIDRGVVVQERVANVDACYLRRLWEAEVSVKQRLGALLAAVPEGRVSAARTVDELERTQGVTYAPQQRKAVELAARESVLILTGGPGTGKTTTVRGIVALFQKMGLDTVLAAPTGRAAKRMSELTGMEAQTVHRLLGMSWNEDARQVTFSKTEKEPLEAGAVVVDEMSMVDLPLFSALLRALRPGTRLVLVGDADQLPSVGAGNVFSDLIRSGRVETVFLREVFRQAEQSAIIRNAHTVNQGGSPDLANNQGDFFFLCRRDPERAVNTLVELCETRLPENMGIPADQIQVLTPTRKGPTGTGNLNRRLQEALNPKAPGKRELLWGERLFREGDRVMQTRNDYDVVWEKEDGTVGTGMFNGDVGRIVKIDDSGEWLELDFDGRRAVYGAEQLNEVDLAFAQTVHKAQGSEYRCVVLAAMPAAPSLMVRGVLYTALTRARELLVAVGDDAAIRAMAANDRQQRRYSGLRWRLAQRDAE